MYLTFVRAVLYRWRRSILFFGVCFWVFVFIICGRAITSKQCHTLQVLGGYSDIPCESLEDCSVLQGSTCLESSHMCVCPGGMVPSSDLTRCLRVAENYGVTCEDNAGCTARLHPGGVCEETGGKLLKACACKEGFHYLHGVCWQSVGLGGSCSKSEQCFENHNYESLSCQAGRCECSVGFYERGGTHCRRAGAGPGDECTFDMDCRFENAVCIGNKCTTSNSVDVHHWWTPDEDEETPSPPRAGRRRDGQACGGDSACGDDSTCTEMMGLGAECNDGGCCWCRRGYYHFQNTTTNTCLRELGEECSQTEDCSHIGHTVCRKQKEEDTGYCACTVAYIATKDNRKCNPLRSFNKSCTAAEMCMNYGPLAVCDLENTKKCRCEEKSHFEEEEQMCWASRGINEDCSSEKDCATPSGVDGIHCSDSHKCQCKPGYHSAGEDCRPDATAVGEPCVEQPDCMFDNSRCVEGVCGCEHGYFAQISTNGKLLCVGGVGSPCNESKDCAVSNTKCDNNTCICDPAPRPALVPSEDYSTCLKVADHYGGACVENMQCQTPYGSNINCLHGVCVCIDTYHFRDQFCWPIRELGEKCSRTGECYLMADSERSECRNGFCQCLYEYEPQDGNLCVSGGASLSSAVVTLMISTVWIFMFVQ